MNNFPIRGIAFCILAPLALAGCDEAMMPLATDKSVSDEASFAAEGVTRTEVRDVERPDIFSASEEGLWDGRPSLGGIWVAHPDVAEPARVLITNTSNGQTVAGALFRRERNNPGPRIQVSSDAAAELGILAGQPTDMALVVVVQEEIEIEVAPPPVAISDEVPNEQLAAPEVPEAEAGIPVAAVSADVADDIVDAAVDVDAAPKRGFWQRFRDSVRTDPAALEPEPAIEVVETIAIVDPAEAQAPVPEVQTATLDPIATVAAAAIDEAEEVEVAAIEVASEPEPMAAPAAAAENSGPLRNPIIQVGLFSVEENANATTESLRSEGIIPTVDRIDRGDVTLWRVLVGPMTTKEDQSTMFERIKELGYRDAFLAPS